MTQIRDVYLLTQLQNKALSPWGHLIILMTCFWPVFFFIQVHVELSSTSAEPFILSNFSEISVFVCQLPHEFKGKNFLRRSTH